MTRLPSVSGERLVRALKRAGFIQLRQKGSHVRLRHPGMPAHNISVPLHNPLKTGTLHGILSEVARMRSLTVEFLAETL